MLMGYFSTVFIEEDHPKFLQPWLEYFRFSSVRAMSAMHRATLDYADVKINRSIPSIIARLLRPTSAQDHSNEHNQWPLGGMVHGNFGRHSVEQAMWEQQLSQWIERYHRFQAWQMASGEFAGDHQTQPDFP